MTKTATLRRGFSQKFSNNCILILALFATAREYEINGQEDFDVIFAIKNGVDVSLNGKK